MRLSNGWNDSRDSDRPAVTTPRGRARSSRATRCTLRYPVAGDT